MWTMPDWLRKPKKRVAARLKVCQRRSSQVVLATRGAARRIARGSRGSRNLVEEGTEKSHRRNERGTLSQFFLNMHSLYAYRGKCQADGNPKKSALWPLVILTR